nr:metallophosphoesterase [Sphingomonas laterariae]
MVLKRLFKLSRPSGRPEASLPAGRRVYAIGDVHGRLDLLDDLLAQIAQDDARRGSCETDIIMLGDLIDRGPESAGVVERLRLLASHGRRIRFLMGNHEEIFLKALGGDVQALRLLIKVGGKETALSYGITAEEYLACDFDELLILLQRKVPQSHVDFLSGFEDCIVLGDCIFVHAGLRPNLPIDEQRTSDLRWIRKEFIDSDADFGGLVIHGHNVTDEIDRRNNRIGIDTGAYASGRLTALGLEGSEQWSLVADEQAARLSA